MTENTKMLLRIGLVLSLLVLIWNGLGYFLDYSCPGTYCNDMPLGTLAFFGRFLFGIVYLSSLLFPLVTLIIFGLAYKSANKVSND